MREQSHLQKKLPRDSISKILLGSLYVYGYREGEMLSLTAEECRNLKTMVERLRRLFNEMEEKGGYVLVKEKTQDIAITTYRLDSFSRKKSLSKKERLIERLLAIQGC